MNDVDFEQEFDLSLKVEDLPVVQLDMQSFRHGPAQHFSLLDTPGPNEAKAAAALQKIGPQVMNMSSGCIFCIPYDQVEGDQMEKLYSHVNIYMGGKRVIVIVTKMDAFKGGDTAKQGIADSILSYFNDNIQEQLKIHFTSGFELLTLYELEAFLEAERARPATFKDQLMSTGKLWKDLDESYNLGLSFNVAGMITGQQAIEMCTKLLAEGRARYDADAVLDSFQDLYADSERLALSGDVANMCNSLAF